MDTCMCGVHFFLCLHEPSSHLTEAWGGRGNFHSVHCLVIVLLQGFTSLYFLRTFGELYAGQDTVLCSTLIWLLGDSEKKEKAESKRYNTGRNR